MTTRPVLRTNTKHNTARTWATTKHFDEHIAARYADLRCRVEAASALLGMGLTVAAKFVLDEPKATAWPRLKQAREWQSSQRRRRTLFDGAL